MSPITQRWSLVAVEELGNSGMDDIFEDVNGITRFTDVILQIQILYSITGEFAVNRITHFTDIILQTSFYRGNNICI